MATSAVVEPLDVGDHIPFGLGLGGINSAVHPLEDKSFLLTLGMT
jgi:hypothetical protein